MSDRAGQRRHCWVVLLDADPMPGVVAGWRRDSGGWAARVAYALEDETGGVVIGWLPASLLRPHDADPAGQPDGTATEGPAGAHPKVVQS